MWLPGLVMAMDIAVAGVRSADEARALYAQLEKKEAEIIHELDELLEQQSQMDVRMAAFQHMLPNLRTLHSDSSELSEAVTRASNLAESVSSKVRLLDAAKSHVYSAMKRVDDVIDLKSCVDGVQYSMNNGDYEKAAAHIHRYLTLDESILLESSADSAKGSSTVSSSFTLLRQYEQELKTLVQTKFQEARDAGNTQDLERFFKIFPLLNLHEEGLNGFSVYLVSQIEHASEEHLLNASQTTTGERMGVAYADTLTMLYEEIARKIERYQPMVETYYGPTWLPFLVKKLQDICDSQVTKVTKQLQEDRMLDHKVQTVSSALKARAATGAIRPDVLELDTLLSEISLCSARTELFFRFLTRKAGAVELPSDCGHQPVSAVIQKSETNHLIQELIGKYILLENYFMRESLTKAVNLDSCNPDGLTSSMADDIFFVLQKCIRRAFSSSNVDGACAMLNHASSLLLTEYKEVLQSRIKASLPSTGLDISGMLQSKLQSTRTGATDTEANKPSTTVALNDIEVSIENVQKLSKDLQSECNKMVGQAGDTAKAKLDLCLADMSSVAANLKELRQAGISKLISVVIVPQLKPTIEVFSTLNHVVTEGDLASYEVNDPFVQQLITTLETVIKDVKGGFLVSLYELVLADIVNEVTFLMEQQVQKCSFNQAGGGEHKVYPRVEGVMGITVFDLQLGGVQLDKDLRNIVGYLSSLTQWPVRDKFARITQMATILSLESVGELLEYWGSNAGPMTWRLTPGEVRNVLKLRNDFRSEDISNLKL